MPYNEGFIYKLRNYVTDTYQKHLESLEYIYRGPCQIE